jgi:hypothetical protein
MMILLFIFLPPTRVVLRITQRGTGLLSLKAQTLSPSAQYTNTGKNEISVLLQKGSLKMIARFQTGYIAD